ncbi:hypothetical protein BDN67DRAFT_986181, partial [Paxillus ammoniavirescens]
MPTATTRVLDNIQNNRTARDTAYSPETTNNRVCRRSHVMDMSRRDDDVSDGSSRRVHNVPSSLTWRQHQWEMKGQGRVEGREEVGRKGRKLNGEADEKVTAATGPGNGATDHKTGGISLVKPTSHENDSPKTHVDTPNPPPPPPTSPTMPVEQLAPTLRRPTQQRAPPIPTPPPPSPDDPEQRRDDDDVKSNTTAARAHADAVHNPGGKMKVPPSIRLEGESNDIDVEDDHNTQRTPRNPVGTTDGDAHRPSEPTEPPDEEEGEQGRVDESRVEDVESRESTQVGEPGDEGVERTKTREDESRRVEGQTGGKDEDNGCQRNGKPDVATNVPRPPAPHPYDTNRPTHLTNPPRRRGRLKTKPTNGYWGSIPGPPQPRTKGTEAFGQRRTRLYTSVTYQYTESRNSREMAEFPQLASDGRNWMEYRDKLEDMLTGRKLAQYIMGMETTQRDSEFWRAQNNLAKHTIV